MKRLLISALLVTSGTACVEANRPVQLLGAGPLDPGTCALASETAELYAGELNFNLGKQYTVAFKFFSPLSTEADDRRTDFYAEEIVLRYESINPDVTFKEESKLIYAVVQPETDGIIRVDLIGNEARKTLETSIPPAPGVMTLLPYVRLKGRLSSGGEVETNEVRFPIDVFRGESCPENTEPVAPPDAPCGFPGQDGNGALCRPTTGG